MSRRRTVNPRRFGVQRVAEVARLSGMFVAAETLGEFRNGRSWLYTRLGACSFTQQAPLLYRSLIWIGVAWIGPRTRAEVIAIAVRGWHNVANLFPAAHSIRRYASGAHM